MLKMTKTKKTLTTKRKGRKQCGIQYQQGWRHLRAKPKWKTHQIPSCICHNKYLLSRLQTFLFAVLGRSIATGQNKLWNLRCMTSLSTLQSVNMSKRRRTARVQRPCFFGSLLYLPCIMAKNIIMIPHPARRLCGV